MSSWSDAWQIQWKVTHTLAFVFLVWWQVKQFTTFSSKPVDIVFKKMMFLCFLADQKEGVHYSNLYWWCFPSQSQVQSTAIKKKYLHRFLKKCQQVLSICKQVIRPRWRWSVTNMWQHWTILTNVRHIVHGYTGSFKTNTSLKLLINNVTTNITTYQ